MTWRQYRDGVTIGTRGSEDGTILVDEEHELGARLTLERGLHAPYAITCGVYGAMVHTIFFNEEGEARAAWPHIQAALVEVATAQSLEDWRGMARACSELVRRWP